MTFSTPQNFFYSGGVWDLSWTRMDLEEHRAATREQRSRLPDPARTTRARAGRRSETRCSGRCRSIRSQELRDVAPYYYDWLHHPPEDPFWDFAELRNKYGRTHAAVLNLSGWHDDNYGPEGATTNYTGSSSRAAGGQSRTALLLGPWVHGVDATARTTFGERDFGRAAAIDYDEVVLDWMDRYVRGDRRAARWTPVRYFVMGDNRWGTSDTWPPPGRSQHLLLVAGQGGDRTGAHAGAARPERAAEHASSPIPTIR